MMTRSRRATTGPVPSQLAGHLVTCRRGRRGRGGAWSAAVLVPCTPAKADAASAALQRAERVLLSLRSLWPYG